MIEMTYDYHAIAWLLSSCVVVRLMYACVHYILETRNKKYATLPLDRQMYIQKNLVKSTYLAALTAFATIFVVWPVVSDNVWDNYLIHRLAVLYVSNDMVGLVCVNSLPKTTRIHHIVTSVLVMISLGLDFQSSDIAQAMLVYTMASSTAYMVNFHLGVRWLCARDELRWLRYTAAAIYVLCCGASWSWHAHWLYTSSSIHAYHFLYLALLSWIVRDDIILMRWLTA